MKVLLIPLTILIGILIIAGIILSNASPITIPSLNSGNNTNNRSSEGAVLKSTDGGRSFEAKSRVNEGSRINLSKNIVKIQNGSNNTIFALTRTGGLFKTDNWGDNWNAILDSSITSTTLGVSPKNVNEAYVGAISEKRARIYRTTDGGKDNKWQEIYTEPKSGTEFVSIQVNPSNDSIVYALLSNGVLLKSFNKGSDWVLARDLKTTVIDMALDPQNPDTVIISGVTRLYISQDGGFNFEESTPKLRPQAVTGSQITSFAINPNNGQEIYIGGSGEIIRSRDRGKTWENLRILTPNSSLAVRNISIAPADSNVIYYTIGSVLYTSSSRGESWNTSDLSSTVKSITTLLIDREKSDILYIGTN